MKFKLILPLLAALLLSSVDSKASYGRSSFRSSRSRSSYSSYKPRYSSYSYHSYRPSVYLGIGGGDYYYHGYGDYYGYGGPKIGGLAGEIFAAIFLLFVLIFMVIFMTLFCRAVRSSNGLHGEHHRENHETTVVETI